MMPNDGYSKRRRVALVLATILLSGCATGASDGGGPGACPPVVQYSRELQVRAAAELVLLPDGSAIEEMLADVAVMREQARTCRRLGGAGVIQTARDAPQRSDAPFSPDGRHYLAKP